MSVQIDSNNLTQQQQQHAVQQRFSSSRTNSANLEPLIEQLEEDDSQDPDPGQLGVNANYDNASNQLTILRQLLTVERQRNEQRRRNNDAMKKYLAQLQNDYLRLQNDLVEALNLGHKIKAQKEAQLEALQATLREKDLLIEKLNFNLSSLDETRVKEEFNVLLEKQQKLFHLDKEQLSQQLKTLEEQLTGERSSHSQQIQLLHSRIDEQAQESEKELSSLRNKLREGQTELDKILSEPKNLVIKSLREELSEANCQQDELNLVIRETQTKYDLLKKRLDNLLSEQEFLERKNSDDFDKLQGVQSDQKKLINELKMELEDKEEVIQIQQFNLQRSEKRIKNLVVCIQGKETTYKDMIREIQSQNNEKVQELETEQRILETKMINFRNELDKKQNELVKLNLEHENQLESMKNDRDLRVAKLSQEREKLDKKLQSLELQLAKKFEEKDAKNKELDSVRKECQQFREEVKRLSIEVTKLEAKLRHKDSEMAELIRKSEEAQDRETSNQMLNLDFEFVKEKNSKLEQEMDSLRKERNDLELRLKMQEAKLSKTSQLIDKEHNKLIQEYKKRLEQLKEEQVVCDQNRIRYRRYGCKLKKYCEHLRIMHQHICDPLICRNSQLAGSLQRDPSTKSLNSIDNNEPATDDFDYFSKEGENYL